MQTHDETGGAAHEEQAAGQEKAEREGPEAEAAETAHGTAAGEADTRVPDPERHEKWKAVANAEVRKIGQALERLEATANLKRFDYTVDEVERIERSLSGEVAAVGQGLRRALERERTRGGDLL